MTLDDRSLREHLDRRAEAGASDLDGIADVVLSRVAQARTGPWWRRVGIRTPSAGVAVAALVVVVVAVAVLPSRLLPGPGTSPSSSASAVIDAYPIDRALTVKELDAVLGSNPSAQAGTILIASVTLGTYDMFCYAIECPRYLAVLEGRSIGVYDPGEAEPELPGAVALQARSDGSLDLLGHVRSGPDGLAWTLPQLTEALVDLKGPGALPVPYLYLVDAWRAVSTAQYRCRAGSGGVFGCGSGVAWLVADETSQASSSAPPGSLRLPNIAGGNLSYGDPQHGYWLVDPFVSQVDCFLCPPAGAADLLGRVPTLEELEVALPTPRPASTTGAPTPTPTVPQPATVEIGFSTGSLALDGFETGDVTVSIDFTGPAQPDPGADPSLAPLIILERDAGDTGDPRDPHIAQLVRALVPTSVAGRWAATFRLTSGDRGVWRVGGIVASDIEGHDLDIDPTIGESSPSLEIIGTHAPHLTMERFPTPAVIGAPLQIFGRLIDEDTGDPLGDIVVTIGQGEACAPGGTGSTVPTDPSGQYKFVIPEADGTTVCAWISGVPGVYPSLDGDGPIALFAALFAEPTN